MVIIYQFCGEHIDFRIGQSWYMHKLQSVIYKLNQFVTEIIDKIKFEKKKQLRKLE